VGEIRAELGGAPPSPEQTTLEAWLRA
jgi:hypothetical protein